MSAAEQYMPALAQANKVRLGHSAVKRELAAGDLSLGQALTDPRSASMRVGEVVVALPGWGPPTMSRLLGRLRVSEQRRCDALTDRQRALLVGRVTPAVSMRRTRTLGDNKPTERTP